MSKSEINIIEDFGELSKNEKGYTKKFVKASWFGKQPAYEVRNFDPDGEPLKRAGLNVEELKKLKEILNTINI